MSFHRNKKPDPMPNPNITPPKIDSNKDIQSNPNPIEVSVQNPPNISLNAYKNLPIKKIEPPKLSARGEPTKNTSTPSDFVDLLDLEDPIQLKNPATTNYNNNNNAQKPEEQENMTIIKINEKKEDNLVINNNKPDEESKNNNPFSFDFNFLSKNQTKQQNTPKKEVDQIDILFG